MILRRRRPAPIDSVEARRIEQRLQEIRTLAAAITAKAEFAQARINALMQREHPSR